MKHYDPEKVEALLGLLLDEGDGWTDAKIVSTMLKIQALAAALRASAREAGEVSGEEVESIALAAAIRYSGETFHEFKTGPWLAICCDAIREALAHFTPPAPEVASEEERQALCNEIAARFWNEDRVHISSSPMAYAAACVDAALAKWGAARKEEKP